MNVDRTLFPPAGGETRSSSPSSLSLPGIVPQRHCACHGVISLSPFCQMKFKAFLLLSYNGERDNARFYLCLKRRATFPLSSTHAQDRDCLRPERSFLGAEGTVAFLSSREVLVSFFCPNSWRACSSSHISQAQSFFCLFFRRRLEDVLPLLEDFVFFYPLVREKRLTPFSAAIAENERCARRSSS